MGEVRFMGEDKQPQPFKIGELAKLFGLNVRTLRYYEDIGLLPAARVESGYRAYTRADVERLRFILDAKRAGFSLEEIQQIIRLGEHGKACGYVRDTLSLRLRAIDAQIADLQRLRAELAEVKAAWEAPGALTGGAFCGLIEGWFSSPATENKGNEMATGKRQVEVFIAGCPLCDPVVELVQRVACQNCAVTVHNVKDDAGAAERAKAAGVTRLPMVLVDGSPAPCCVAGPVTEDGLRAAGIGAG